MKNRKYNIGYYTSLVKIIVLLRLIFGPTIFVFPRITSIMSFILDWMDGEFFKRAGYDHIQREYSIPQT